MQLFPFTRVATSMCFGSQKYVIPLMTVRTLRTSSMQYYSFLYRNLNRYLKFLNIRKRIASQKRKFANADHDGAHLNQRQILLTEYERGLEDTLAVFRSTKKSQPFKWIFRISVLVMAYEFLRIIYSLNSFITFSRPPKPFSHFINRRLWIVPKNVKLTFSDVIGCEEAKAELRTVVHALTSPESFSRLGAHPPRGILLVGPPGVGKTLLGRAVAGEAKVTFLQANGSEFDGSLVGDGARRVHELFALARSRSPCVVFIDSVDSVCPRRVDVPNEPTATLTTNQFLIEMDGLLSDSKQTDGVIIVLGATNREDLLDPAALREGRFGTKLHLRPPEREDRLRLLNYYLDRVTHTIISPAVLEQIARRSAGMTGADIANVVNRAALLAGLADVDTVAGEHLLAALDQLQWGVERPTHFTKATRYAKAVHEAGHAVLARFTKDAPDVCRVSICPEHEEASHGRTCLLPDEADRPLKRTELLARLDVLLGGRMAEEELLGWENVSCDAAVDLQKASRIAVDMVRSFGMSARVGLRSLPVPTAVDGENESRDLARSFPLLSSGLEDQIDAEVARLLWESCARVRAVIRARLKELRRVVIALEAYETLDAEDLSAVLIGGVPKAGVERESEAEQNITRWSNF